MESKQYEIPEDAPKELHYLWSFLEQRDGGVRLAQELPTVFNPSNVVIEGSLGKRLWQAFGLYFIGKGLFHQALPIFYKLYDHMLAYQQESCARTVRFQSKYSIFCNVLKLKYCKIPYINIEILQLYWVIKWIEAEHHRKAYADSRKMTDQRKARRCIDDLMKAGDCHPSIKAVAHGELIKLHILEGNRNDYEAEVEAAKRWLEPSQMKVESSAVQQLIDIAPLALIEVESRGVQTFDGSLERMTELISRAIKLPQKTSDIIYKVQLEYNHAVSLITMGRDRAKQIGLLKWWGGIKFADRAGMVHQVLAGVQLIERLSRLLPDRVDDYSCRGSLEGCALRRDKAVAMRYDCLCGSLRHDPRGVISLQLLRCWVT